MTDARLMKTPMAPAMKNAGTRHRKTCSRAYHLTNSNASVTALSKRGIRTGK
jgi:hypothetical protein